MSIDLKKTNQTYFDIVCVSLSSYIKGKVSILDIPN